MLLATVVDRHVTGVLVLAVMIYDVAATQIGKSLIVKRIHVIVIFILFFVMVIHVNKLILMDF